MMYPFSIVNKVSIELYSCFAPILIPVKILLQVAQQFVIVSGEVIGFCSLCSRMNLSWWWSLIQTFKNLKLVKTLELLLYQKVPPPPYFITFKVFLTIQVVFIVLGICVVWYVDQCSYFSSLCQPFGILLLGCLKSSLCPSWMLCVRCVFLRGDACVTIQLL